MRQTAFICYSHSDSDALEDLKKYLKPHLRDHPIIVWDDTSIRPGSDWKQEIQKALRAARVAILLVSADFLASDFIHTEELPRLLEAAQTDGLKVLWVAVRPSAYSIAAFARYQGLNNPKNPISGLTKQKKQVEWVRIADEIMKVFASVVEDPNTKLASVLNAFGFLTGNRDGAQYGCAVLVARDVILTTRNALAPYTMPGPPGLKFRDGFSMQVDFRKSCSPSADDAFHVTDVIAVLGDFVALRINTSGAQRLPAPLACFEGPVAEGRTIRLLTFTATGNNTLDAITPFLKKWLPLDRHKITTDGRVVEHDGRIIKHNCDILGEAEGGPLVDLKTGNFIGVHTYKYNNGLPLSMLADTPFAEQIGLEFFDRRRAQGS